MQVCKHSHGPRQQSTHEQQQQQQQHQLAEQQPQRQSGLSASTSYSHPAVVAGPPPGDPSTGLRRELQSRCSIASSSSSGGDCSSRPWSSGSRPLSGSSRPLSGSSSRPLSSAGALGQQQQQQQRRQQQQQQQQPQQQLHKTVSEGSVAAAAWAPHTHCASGPRVRSATATISTGAASEPLQPALPVLQRRTSLSVRSTAHGASMQQLPLLAPRRQ